MKNLVLLWLLQSWFTEGTFQASALLILSQSLTILPKLWVHLWKAWHVELVSNMVNSWEDGWWKVNHYQSVSTYQSSFLYDLITCKASTRGCRDTFLLVTSRGRRGSPQSASVRLQHLDSEEESRLSGRDQRSGPGKVLWLLETFPEGKCWKGRTRKKRERS